MVVTHDLAVGFCVSLAVLGGRLTGLIFLFLILCGQI